MKLYTSYYSRDGANPKAVGISIYPPKGYKGKLYPQLAPSWHLLNTYHQHLVSDIEYTYWFMGILREDRKLNAHQVVEELGDGAILLCYELPHQFCHRHLVANWIRTETGIVIEELSTLPPNHAIVDELLGF
jgi:hypothetical protein